MRSANENARRRPRSTTTSWALLETRGSMRTSVAGWQPARRADTVALAVHRLRPGAVVALVALLLALAGATGATAQQPAVPTPPPTPAQVRVMTFNIWLGGDVVDFGKVVAAVQAAQADIVGVQEAEGNARRLAEALGWPYWSDRLHVVSRFPLIDPPEAHGEYVLAQVRPGQVFAPADVHLTSDPYGPYLVRADRSLAQVLANERATRLPEIRATLG